MKLAHMALWTHDLEAESRFWHDFFDAEVGDRYDSTNRPGLASRFVQLPDADVRIELMQGPWVTVHQGEASGWDHIALAVGSIARVVEIAERFRRDGLLVSAPRRTGDEYYEAVVRSPDGTVIEIVE